MDPKLLAILVCPADRGPLVHVDDLLYNPRLRKAYRVEEGIPVLLVDEATDVSAEEHERLVTRAGDQSSDDSGDQ
ncbi:MAG: Trm112 family protein [Mycobacterium sp.]|nr:Trm112 family protein [Mycobacterium sp.]